MSPFLPPEEIAERGLCAEAIVGQFKEPIYEGEPLRPERFVSNRPFIDVLHGVIEEFAPTSAGFALEAEQHPDGMVAIVDWRTKALDGRIPPEDIFGVFQLKGVLPVSYHRIEKHRLFTTDGFFKLPEDLHQCLLTRLRERNASAFA
jgi:hypothetical protein